MTKIAFSVQALLFFPFFIFAQSVEIAVGVEFRPEIYFHRTERTLGEETYFDKYWSVDVTTGAGTDVEISYGRFGVGAGLFSTRLGLNKNNPDSSNRIFGNGRPYAFDKVKYRASYFEVPLHLFYKVSKRRINLKLGLSYSFYWLHRSFLKEVKYYQHNVDDEQHLRDGKNYLVENVTDDFNSIYPYGELELKFKKFSISYKIGARIHTGKYHEMFIDKPTAVAGGISLNYYLLKNDGY